MRAPQPCARCAFLDGCGGLEQQTFFGCFGGCGQSCTRESCDYVCPYAPQFARYLSEVGGLDTPPGPLRAATAKLPGYIPLIQHGSSRGRPLDWPFVAVSISRLFRRGRRRRLHGGGDPAAFRRAFGVRSDARVLIVSVAQDDVLERYWAHPRRQHVAELLAESGVDAMTLPNFSFFTDAPRTHTMWSRRRSIIVGEELSRARLGVIPHLNALTREDWRYWADLLRERSDITIVAKEFQTGLRVQAIADHAIRSLAELQQRVARPLHLVAVGAARFASELSGVMEGRITIIDSTPFMAAMKRKELNFTGDGAPRWRKSATPNGEALSRLLATNVAAHDAWVHHRIETFGSVGRDASRRRYLRVVA